MEATALKMAGLECLGGHCARTACLPGVASRLLYTLVLSSGPQWRSSLRLRHKAFSEAVRCIDARLHRSLYHVTGLHSAPCMDMHAFTLIYIYIYNIYIYIYTYNMLVDAFNEIYEL